MRSIAGLIAFMTIVVIAVIMVINELIKNRKHNYK